MPDLVPSRTVRATVSDHGAILLDLRGRGRWFALSPSAARWWTHLASGLTADNAAAAVADHYNVPPERVQADMRELAERLQKRRLLRARGRWQR